MLRRGILGLFRFSEGKLMNENVYLQLAREKLGELGDMAEEMGGEDMDIAVTDKILRITSGKLAIVINTQTPNRQLWYSSNLSGPQRFDYDEEGERWVSQAQKVLDEVLKDDLSRVE